MIHKFCILSLSLLATAALASSQTRSVLIPVTPCRMVDTRQASGPLAGPDMLAGTTRSFPVPTSACGVPATASAYSLNVTVVPAGPLQYLTIWPTGQTQPVVSTLNDNSGQVIANAAIVPAGTSGAISVFVTDETNVIIDIDGYFTLEQSDTSSQSTAYGAGALANDTSSLGGNSAFGTNALAANTTGGNNTASGYQALSSNINGINNSAFGNGALSASTGGNYNSAFGQGAMTAGSGGNYNSAFGYAAMGASAGTYNTASGVFSFISNKTGTYNTASGAFALATNSTGSYNTGSGGSALYGNSTGSNNTASGYQALYGSNNTGSGNTASGYQSLFSNTTGSNNTASGSGALYSNTTGYNNTAAGVIALQSNTTGTYNTATGNYSLQNNIGGSFNTASGDSALFYTTGSSNTALGYFAGGNNTAGNYNVDIANYGAYTDSGIMRIGTSGQQTATFISGITGVTVTGSAVIVNSNGQLGVASSSIKFKEDVQNLGDADSNALMQLRPVSFRYKGTSPVQYGLIAEEVDQVIPSLVSRDSNGDPMSVQYHELPALLLSQIQRQQRTMEDQSKQLTDQRELVQRLEKRLSDLEARSKTVEP